MNCTWIPEVIYEWTLVKTNHNFVYRKYWCAHNLFPIFSGSLPLWFHWKSVRSFIFCLNQHQLYVQPLLCSSSKYYGTHWRESIGVARMLTVYSYWHTSYYINININSVNKVMQASIPLILFYMTNPAEWGPTFSLYMALSGWKELQNVEKRKKGTLPHCFYRLFWMRRLVHPLPPHNPPHIHSYTYKHHY